MRALRERPCQRQCQAHMPCGAERRAALPREGAHDARPTGKAVPAATLGAHALWRGETCSVATRRRHQRCRGSGIHSGAWGEAGYPLGDAEVQEAGGGLLPWGRGRVAPESPRGAGGAQASNGCRQQRVSVEEQLAVVMRSRGAPHDAIAASGRWRPAAQGSARASRCLLPRRRPPPTRRGGG